MAYYGKGLLGQDTEMEKLGSSPPANPQASTVNQNYQNPRITLGPLRSDPQKNREALERYAREGDWAGWQDYRRNTIGGAKKIKKKSFEKYRMKFLGQDLRDQAKDFESNIDKYANDQYGLLESDVKRNLDEGLENTRENFSNRGLLFSGLRQKSESDKRGQAASVLAQGRAGINRDLRNQADAKKQVAAQFGLASYQQALDSADELSQMQMQNALARRRAAAQIGQGLGYAAGAYYGSQDPDVEPMETSGYYEVDQLLPDTRYA